jgi:hypothetical protein
MVLMAVWLNVSVVARLGGPSTMWPWRTTRRSLVPIVVS